MFSDAAVSMVVQVFNWMASKPVSGSLASNSQPRDLTATGFMAQPPPFQDLRGEQGTICRDL
jgi:hypothetical protein